MAFFFRLAQEKGMKHYYEEGIENFRGCGFSWFEKLESW